MLVPIILGSDKTTVSVATGHNEYWPVYLSIGIFKIMFTVLIAIVSFL